LDGFTPVAGQKVNVAVNQNELAPMPLSPLPAKLVYFNSSLATITQGESVMLSWQVSHALTVTIEPLDGAKPATSTAQVTPDKTTVYHLDANGVRLGEVKVEVNARPKAPEPAQVAVQPAAPAAPKLPDFEVLKQAVMAYKSVFVQASTKNSKECQALLNGSYQGALRSYSSWCGNAKQFIADDKCTEAPAGTPEAPTLACNEVITVNTKDGTRASTPTSRKTFHFAKNPDGSWHVTRLD
jgi:hypothetical protein